MVLIKTMNKQLSFWMRWILFSLSLLLSGVEAMAASSNVKQSIELFHLMNKRFILMEEVALYKYLHHLPITHPEVENKLLLSVKKDAQDFALPVKETQKCMQLQMKLAVTIQEKWHEKWRKNDLKTERAPDLDNVLRPQISYLTHAIVEQIAASKDELADMRNLPELTQAIDEIINVPYIEHDQKEALLQSLIVAAKAPV